MKICGGLRGGQIHEGAGMGRAGTLLLILLGHTCAALEIAVPPSQVGTVQTDAVLSCTFKVENMPVKLQFLAIFWHFGDKEVARYDLKAKESTSRFSIDEQTLMWGDASLTIRSVSVSDRGTYRCTVVYSPDTQEKLILLNILAAPEVRIQKKAVQRGVTSLLQCSITNFFPSDMKVVWLKNGQILRRLVAQDDKMNADKTFTRNSAVNVTFLKEEVNPKITCQVEHEYLQDPIKDSYIVQYGVAPTVNIKASRTPDGSDQIYMCEASNYFPEAVTMSWLLDGKRMDSTRQSNNGYFSNEICYRMQLDGTNPPSQISCEVQHETLYSSIRITEDVQVERDCRRSCHFGLLAVLLGLLMAVPPALWYFMWWDSRRLRVGDVHRRQTAGDKVILYCMAFSCRGEVRVTWTILEGDGPKIVISDMRQERDEEAALIVSSHYTVETDRSDERRYAMSTLSFTPNATKHKDMEATCKFQCDGGSQEKRLRFNCIVAKPEASGPVRMSLGDGGDVLCSFSVQNIYPKDMKIRWSHGLEHLQPVETSNEAFTKNGDMFNVRSDCRLPGHLFKDQGYRVRATWSHKAESGQQEVSVTDSDWRPVMGEIEKSSFIDGKEAELRCRVAGYFPDVLDVKWLRREAESQELCVVSAGDKYKIRAMEATQQEDKTFTYTACLTLSVSAAADYGAEFICRVTHPALKTPLEKRTGKLGVVGIGAVNVTRPRKEKLRADVLHFTSKDFTITWSRSYKGKLQEYKDAPPEIQGNSDSGYTGYSEIKVTQNAKDRKQYRVVVEDKASNSVVEKNVLRENGEFYLLDNEGRKTLVPETTDQQPHGDNAESPQPATETSRAEEKPVEEGKNSSKKRKHSLKIFQKS